MFYREVVVVDSEMTRTQCHFVSNLVFLNVTPSGIWKDPLGLVLSKYK